MPEIAYDRLNRMGHVHPERQPIADEEQIEIDNLTGRYEALIEEHGDDPPYEIAAEVETLSERIDALS